MKERLKNYLSKRSTKPLDASVVESYTKTMKESTVPEIIDDIKQNEQLSAELRFLPTATAKRKRRD